MDGTNLGGGRLKRGERKRTTLSASMLKLLKRKLLDFAVEFSIAFFLSSTLWCSCWLGSSFQRCAIAASSARLRSRTSAKRSARSPTRRLQSDMALIAPPSAHCLNSTLLLITAVTARASPAPSSSSSSSSSPSPARARCPLMPTFFLRASRLRTQHFSWFFLRRRMRAAVVSFHFFFNNYFLF